MSHCDNDMYCNSRGQTLPHPGVSPAPYPEIGHINTFLLIVINILTGVPTCALKPLQLIASQILTSPPSPLPAPGCCPHSVHRALMLAYKATKGMAPPYPKTPCNRVTFSAASPYNINI